jgi:hypothetical protein
MSKSLRTPLENKQEVLQNGLCIWSIWKLDGSGWACGVDGAKDCCVLSDPKNCPSITDEKEVAKKFMERDIPREHY